MKRFLTLLLAACMALGSVTPVLAEDAATPGDIPTRQPAQAEETATPEATQTPEDSAKETPDVQEPEATDVPAEDDEQETLRPEATDATETPADSETTQAPEEQPTAEPSPTAPAADYGTGPLYVMDGEVRHYGTPEELIPLNETLYLYHMDVVEIAGIDVEELSRLTYALDPEVFAEGEYTIYLSVRDPQGVVKEDTVYLWVEEKKAAADTEDRLEDVITAEDEDVLEWELQAIPMDYVSGEPCRPTFTLMALPEIQEGMRYAVILDGGDPVAIQGSTYAPEQSGEYRFALLDAEGKVIGRSAKYKVIYMEETPAPTEEPSPVPTEEATQAPTAEPTVVPTAVPPMSMDDLIADMDSFIQENGGTASSNEIAWAMVDGQRVSGSLDELLLAACDTIYIATGKTIVLSGDVTALAGKTLLPDPDVFGDDYVVTIADSSNSVEVAGALFVSVQRRSNADATEAALQVEAAGFTSGKWINQLPTFVLTSEPDLPGTVGGYSYAVSVNGGAAIRLEESAYTAVEEGEYSLRFSVVDPDNGVVTQSGEYAVKLDVTAPLLQVSAGRDGSVMVVAGDLGSGAVSCSMDGGATWQMLTDQGDGVAAYTTAVTQTTEYAPGMILVQDRAGNRTSNQESVTVTVQAGGSSGMSGFGGFGGSSSSSRSTSHASSEETTVTVYNGVELILDDGSMNQLTVGEEALELYLMRDGMQEDEEAPAFTAAFMVFSGDENEDADTLVLTANGVTEDNAAEYVWQFSGQVYKKLAASGIDYLVLRCGDYATVLSTAGFTAGIRYSMFRAEGLPSKDFTYTLRMGLEEDGIQLDVTVGGQCWQLTDDPQAEIYYYDVVTGTVDTFDMLKG